MEYCCLRIAFSLTGYAHTQSFILAQINLKITHGQDTLFQLASFASEAGAAAGKLRQCRSRRTEMSLASPDSVSSF